MFWRSCPNGTSNLSIECIEGIAGVSFMSTFKYLLHKVTNVEHLMKIKHMALTMVYQNLTLQWAHRYLLFSLIWHNDITEEHSIEIKLYISSSLPNKLANSGIKFIWYKATTEECTKCFICFLWKENRKCHIPIFCIFLDKVFEYHIVKSLFSLNTCSFSRIRFLNKFYALIQKFHKTFYQILSIANRNTIKGKK